MMYARAVRERDRTVHANAAFIQTLRRPNPTPAESYAGSCGAESYSKL